MKGKCYKESVNSTAFQQSFATSQNEIPLHKMMYLCAVNIDPLLHKCHAFIMVQLLSLDFLEIFKTFKSETTFLFARKYNTIHKCDFMHLSCLYAERSFPSLI